MNSYQLGIGPVILKSDDGVVLGTQAVVQVEVGVRVDVLDPDTTSLNLEYAFGEEEIDFSHVK